MNRDIHGSSAPQTRLSKLRGLIKNNPFLRHNLTFFVGSLAVSALNYLFYPVLGHMMSPADFGEVQILNSLFLQAGIFFGVLSYIVIHVTVNITDEQERNQTLLGIERVAMIIGFSLLAIALIFVNQLRVFLNFAENWPFVSLIAALSLSIPLIIRMAYLRGQKKFFRTSITDGIGSAAKLLLAPIFVIFGWRSFGAIGALAISQAISLAVVAVWARQAGFRGTGLAVKRLRLDLIKPYFKHAAAILLGAGGITFMQSLDVVTVKHYFPATVAGRYAGISIISNIVIFLMAPITGVLLTLVRTHEPKSGNQLRLKASLGLIVLVGGATLTAMTLFPDLIIKILVGSKYLTYAHYLPRLGLAMLMLGISSALMMYHIALKRYWYSIASIVNFVLMLGLMRVNHGTIGAVVSNIMFGSCLLLVVTVSQNIYFKHHQYEEGDY